jgi:hypothetical protein
VAERVASVEEPPVMNYVRLNILAACSGSDATGKRSERDVLRDRVEEEA